jgi:hypothetical protein
VDLFPVLALVSAEWIWLLVPLFGFVVPVAGAVVGWLALRKRGWRAVAVACVAWGGVGVAVYFVLALATPVAEAVGVGAWAYAFPCLFGAGAARLTRSVAARQR